MNFWTRITETDYQRLVRNCNFTQVELMIFDLRRKDTAPEIIAHEIKYSERHARRFTKNVKMKEL